ncbi:retrovirus-related pol polyprotein from transposon TNT 1-94 [Tanacetum coccineum]
MNHLTLTVPQVIPQVAYQSPQAPTKLMTESPFIDSGFTVPVFSPGDDLIVCLNKGMAFLTAVAFSRFPSTNNQLRTSSNPRNQAIIQDGRIEDLDTYDSDCDDLSTAQEVLMANISNYCSDVILEVPNSETYLNDMDNQSVHALQDFEQSPVFKDQFDSIKQTRVRHKEQCDSLINKLNLKSVENEDLKAQIQDKVYVITSLKNDLRKLKGKEIVENVVHTPSVTTIAPGMFKLDLVPLPPRLLQNRDAHIDYLRHTQEQANTLREIVKQAKAKQPLDRVKCSTSNCGSKPSGNKRNARISQTPSRNKKNKHSLSNANSKILCATCNKSMFDGVHDKCLLDLVQNGNNRTKSAKKHKKQNIWKPTGHVFTEVGFKWKPTGRTFTIVACALGKSKKSSHQPKAEDTNQEKLYLLHMDLCGLMRVASINRKRYILVIVDDYSRFTWVRFLKTKDEAPAAIIKCIKNIQVRLNATVQNVRTNNGTEFVNQTLREFYENVGISHQTSVARTPQQNGVVERRNRTLVEAARTMLIFSKAPLFLWAEAINTACYTQNRSLIRHRYNKIPYELMQDKKPDLSFFHVFGSLCYPTNDHEDLGKFNAKADIGIFVAMASEQFSSGSGLHYMTLATSSTGLVSNPVSQQPFQEAAAPGAKVLADSPVSTSIDQDGSSIYTKTKNIL